MDICDFSLNLSPNLSFNSDPPPSFSLSSAFSPRGLFPCCSYAEVGGLAPCRLPLLPVSMLPVHLPPPSLFPLHIPPPCFSPNGVGLSGSVHGVGDTVLAGCSFLDGTVPPTPGPPILGPGDGGTFLADPCDMDDTLPAMLSPDPVPLPLPVLGPTRQRRPQQGRPPRRRHPEQKDLRRQTRHQQQLLQQQQPLQQQQQQPLQQQQPQRGPLQKPSQRQSGWHFFTRVCVICKGKRRRKVDSTKVDGDKDLLFYCDRCLTEIFPLVRLLVMRNSRRHFLNFHKVRGIWIDFQNFQV
jgi:hypothetical protein